MRQISGTTEFKIQEKTAITLGKFDGLHRGHQKLISKILEKQKQGYYGVVFTFEDSPYRVLRPEVPSSYLLSSRERQNLLQDMGIDCVVEFPFTKEIAAMEPEEFVSNILVSNLNAGYITLGTDFCFGHNRRGNAACLQELGKKYGFEVEIVEKEQFNHREISSSYIKEEIQQGNLELANQLLGYPYIVGGIVQYGRQIGSTILDMPTANLCPETEKMLPPNGVYYSETKINGQLIPGITNVGYKPTVGGETSKGVETYLFDYEADLYGKEIQVGLLLHERAERKFDSLDKLKERLQKDIAMGREFFKQRKVQVKK